MTCDIFIRTHSKDAAYHEKAMASIEKYCSGFRDVVVINQDDGNARIGYLKQQIDKCHADLHSDADFFFMIDSDTIIKQPVTPETYMREGKPLWLFTPFDQAMLAHHGTKAWFDVMTEFFGGLEPHAEFMRRQGFMVPRNLLSNVRNFCKVAHKKSLEDYVMSKGRFSEFNVLGAYAHRFMTGSFHWIDTSKDELPELTLVQFWSHDPIEKNIEEINRILSV